jgi:hypothetical protein
MIVYMINACHPIAKRVCASFLTAEGREELVAHLKNLGYDDIEIVEDDIDFPDTALEILKEKEEGYYTVGYAANYGGASHTMDLIEGPYYLRSIYTNETPRKVVPHDEINYLLSSAEQAAEEC